MNRNQIVPIVIVSLILCYFIFKEIKSFGFDKARGGTDIGDTIDIAELEIIQEGAALDNNVLPEHKQDFTSTGGKGKETMSNEQGDLREKFELSDNEKLKDIFDRAEAYSQEQDYDKAIVEFTNLIRNNYRLAFSYAHRGSSYLALGSNDLAIFDFTKSLEIEPNGFVYWFRGNAYYKKGLTDKALEDFNKARELNPDLANKYYDESEKIVEGKRKEIDQQINILNQRQEELEHEIRMDDLREEERARVSQVQQDQREMEIKEAMERKNVVLQGESVRQQQEYIQQQNEFQSQQLYLQQQQLDLNKYKMQIESAKAQKALSDQQQQDIDNLFQRKKSAPSYSTSCHQEGERVVCSTEQNPSFFR